VVITPDGVRHSSVTGTDGRATLFGIPDGVIAVDVWASGYLPDRLSAAVSDGAGEGSVALVRGEVGAAVIVPPRQLSPEEVTERGIDPVAVENNHVFETEIRLHYVVETPEDPEEEPDETHYQRASTSCRFIWWSALYYYYCHGIHGGPGDPYGTGGGGGDGFNLGETQYIPSIEVVEGVPIIEWLVIPVRGSFMKEFFDVSLIVQNLASEDSGAVFTDGSAYLHLPSGLSLAPVVDPARAQSQQVAVDDVPAGTSRTVSWTVRGDIEGEYQVRADYAGTLQPFGAQLNLIAHATEPLKVWAGSALELSVAADPVADRWMPYRVSTTLTNTTDPGTGPTVYNVHLALGERPSTAPPDHAKYLYAPETNKSGSWYAIAPGESVTLSAIVFPGIGSDMDAAAGGRVPENLVRQMRLDLEESSLAQTSGVTITIDENISPHATNALRTWASGSINWATRPGDEDEASFLTLTWGEPATDQTITGYTIYTRDSLVGGSWRPVATPPLGPSDRSVTLDPRDGALGGYFTVVTETADGGHEAFHRLLMGPARYVALGDSYSSGEGVPEFEAGTDTDREHMGNLSFSVDWSAMWTQLKNMVMGVTTDNTCHRSETGSYSRILAADESFGRDLAPTDVASCSGAVTADVTSPNPVQANEPAQVDHLNQFTQVVTLTMGGNDVGFADVAAHCIVPGMNCAGYLTLNDLFAMQSLVDEVDLERAKKLGAVIKATYEVFKCPRTMALNWDTLECIKAVKDLLDGTVELVTLDPNRVAQASLAMRPEYEERLKRSYRAIAERAPNAAVYVADYPNLFDHGPWARECSVAVVGGVTISRAEATAVNGFVDILNATSHHAIEQINAELGRHQFRAVPVAATFAGRELCANGQLNSATAFHPLINPYLSWLDAYDVVSFSFHPNAEGQRLYAEAFAEAMRSRTSGVIVIGGDEDVSEPFTVGLGASSVTAAAAVDGRTDYDLSLVDPGGRVYTSASPGATEGVTDGQRWLTLPNPAPAGEWHATLSPRWTSSSAASEAATMGAAAGEGTDPALVARLTITVDDGVRAPTASGSVTETSAGQWRFEASGLRPGDSAAWAFADGTVASGATVVRSVPDGHVPSAILTVTGADAQSASADVMDASKAPPRELPVVTEPEVGVPDGTVGTGTVLTARDPRVLTALDSLDYQWYRDGEPVPGATGRTYAVTAADLGHDLAVTVTARRAGYADVAIASEGVLVPGGPQTPDPGGSDPTPTSSGSDPGRDPDGSDPTGDPGGSDPTGDPGGSDQTGDRDDSDQTRDPGGSGQTPDPGGSGKTPSPGVLDQTPPPGGGASAAPPDGGIGKTGLADAPVLRVSMLRTAATKIRLVRGKTVTLPVIAYPAAGAQGKVSVSWTRTGTAIAVGGSTKASGTVGASLGSPARLSIKAKAPGTSKVRLTAGGRSLTVAVTVVAKAQPVTKVKIRGTMSLTRGATALLTAGPRPAKATGAIPRWKSSKPSVATVDAVGRIVAKKRGKTVVTLTVGGVKTRAKVTVR
jgi:hypothetical protein